ncbi:MAG: BON domain-containing protein [Woeseia sp.]
MSTSTTKSTRKLLIPGLILGVALAGNSYAGDDQEDGYQGKMKDAWLDGRIGTAFTLNRHLNPFSIDTKVENGVVLLEGEVESDIDRDLAGEIAQNVDGVSSVKNELTVSGDNSMEEMKGKAKKTANNFMQTVGDATTTAAVKTRLMANGNTKGLSINVDTKDDVVTLSGTVESSEERDLAEALAKNTGDVERVDNKLVVSNQ